jgi:hypothetical protein
MSHPLETNDVVTAEVQSHQPWGVELRLLPPSPDLVGVADIVFVTDQRPFNAPEDYPPIGCRVDAVVLGCTPSGQLRLSLRESDLDRARGTSID